MFYIVNAATEEIIGEIQGYQEPDPQEQADYYRVPIYVIRGEHSGLSAEPEVGACEEADDA